MVRTYVITGSASGIGKATAELLTERGQRVIGVDVHDADVIADLSTPEGRTALVEQVRERSGGAIDAIIANAGLATATPATVAVNYFGALALASVAVDLRVTQVANRTWGVHALLPDGLLTRA